MAKKDYSNLNKDELIKVIEQLEKRKRYGLVWDAEKVPEKVVQDCQKYLPVLNEVKELEINSDENQPTHILIEGDNYHALSVLNYTHHDRIDAIYIDPPYNTGSVGNTFIYNDKIIDKNDSYRHSKWINFMEKRLSLAKRLMKDEAPIFISIDDNEIAQLSMICKMIFGEDNFIACLPTVMNLKGNQGEFGFAGTHEYTLVYCKNKSKCKLYSLDIDDEALDDWELDEIGLFKKGANLKASGAESVRESRPLMFYPILVDKSTKSVMSIEEHEYIKIYNKKDGSFNDEYILSLKDKYEHDGYYFVLPYADKNAYGRWRWGWTYENKRKLETDTIVVEDKDTVAIYKKQRPSLGEIPTKKPKSILYKPEYSSGNGTAEIKRLFNNKKVFNNPKPISLIKDILSICAPKNGIVLDFFAGSGTTANAIAELNNEKNMNITSISITNNENSLCRNVTYPRIKSSLQGYTYKQGNRNISVPGANNNFKYYITDFLINSNNKDQIKIDITLRCTEMLCLKEGIYNLIYNKNDWKIYMQSNRFMAVYYNFVDESLDELKQEMNNIKGDKVLYCFTLDPIGLKQEDFWDWENTRLEPIPQKILDVYKRIFKRK